MYFLLTVLFLANRRIEQWCPAGECLSNPGWGEAATAKEREVIKDGV